MDKPAGASQVDSIQRQIAAYACDLRFTDLSEQAVHAAKGLAIDTSGVLLAGFSYEPCRAMRTLASPTTSGGATILGTQTRTTVDMAAFLNAATARYIEANDVYARYKNGHMHGHPSDVIMPLLSVAEHAHCSGRDFLLSVVIAYEIYLGLCDAVPGRGFDSTTFGGVAVAAAAGRLLGLDRAGIGHAIASSAVANNILTQVRSDRLTPWKAIAAGHAGKAGVFAALMARAGLPGPDRPFEGKSGWCTGVAGSRFSLELAVQNSAEYKIQRARIKTRPARALTIAAIVAAEKVRPSAAQLADVKRIVIEVHFQAKRGTHEEHWAPDSRETADHSIPFSVAAALLDGIVTPHSFDEARLQDPGIKALIGSMELAANESFTAAFEATPQHYRARVTLETGSGQKLVGESGGDEEDLAMPKSDGWIDGKFKSMTQGIMDAASAEKMLSRLWRLEDAGDVASVPALFSLPASIRA